MNKIRLLLSVLTVLSLSSCETLRNTVPIANLAADGIQPGMTPAEVQVVMKGMPQYRSFEGDREVWEYRTYVAGMLAETKIDHVVIGFTDGRVSDMKSYAEKLQPQPSVEVNTKVEK